MNKYLLPIIMLFVSLSVQSQSHNSEWRVGLSGSVVKLNNSNVLDSNLEGELHNFQFPKLNVFSFQLHYFININLIFYWVIFF